MSAFTNLPGPEAVQTASQRRLVRGYPSSIVLLGVKINSAAADSTNTPTTELRTGLVMGQISASGEYAQYNPAATNGTQFPVGLLWEDRKMTDDAGSAQAKTGQLVMAGPVVASSVIGLDPRVRQFLGARIIFDDYPIAEPTGWFGPVAKTADYMVVEADSGKMFTNQGAAGAVNFTLPTTIKAGFRAKFYCETNQTITVTAPADKLVAFNDPVATAIALSTASEKVGGAIEITTNADQTKYLSHVYLGIETQTPVVTA